MDFSLIKSTLHEACSEVSALQLTHFEKLNSNQIIDKGKNQLVSFVDIESEKILVKKLQSVLPEAGFITEEETVNGALQEYNFIIDPLDGTTNYLHGLPVFSISVALQKNNETIVGMVYCPALNEIFYTEKNAGAFLNTKKIAVSSCNIFSQSILATGFPYYNFEKINEYLEVLKNCMQHSHGLRRMGSAAIDLAYLATGRFECFFELGLNAWDVAAGALLISEAGGTVTDLYNQQNYIFGKNIVASNGLLHNEMLNIVSRLK